MRLGGKKFWLVAILCAAATLNRFTNLKVEAHFMDGIGLPGAYPSGFYTADKPQGLKPNTDAFVLKARFNR